MNPALVVPTYNEGENLPLLITKLRSTMPDMTVFIVDDASPDGTGQIAEDLANSLGSIHVLHRSAKRGLGSAYREGFNLALEAGHDPLFQMDADLSHDPAVLPAMLELDADLVLGSRYVPGGGTQNWPLSRRLISRLGCTWARIWLDLPYRDLTGGFKCWRASCLRALDLSGMASEGYVFQVETTWRAHQLGFSIVQTPITFVERTMGRSKMNFLIAAEAAWRVPSLRFRP